MKCRVCMEDVNEGAETEHLVAAHPAPEGGFVFFYEGKPFTTPKPSMLVGELLTLVQGNAMYQFYEEREGEMFPLSHGNAVDVTRCPHFFVVPPATF